MKSEASSHGEKLCYEKSKHASGSLCAAIVQIKLFRKERTFWFGKLRNMRRTEPCRNPKNICRIVLLQCFACGTQRQMLSKSWPDEIFATHKSRYVPQSNGRIRQIDGQQNIIENDSTYCFVTPTASKLGGITCIANGTRFKTKRRLLCHPTRRIDSRDGGLWCARAALDYSPAPGCCYGCSAGC
jgi:hypothetical protein